MHKVESQGLTNSYNRFIHLYPSGEEIVVLPVANIRLSIYLSIYPSIYLSIFFSVHKVVVHGLSYCHKCCTLFETAAEKSLHDDFLHAAGGVVTCHVCATGEAVGPMATHLANVHQVGKENPGRKS